MSNDFQHQFKTFPSGLRLVTVPMPSTKTATVLVLVGTGSKYEAREINGISHFLEHMMFKGTTKRPGYLDISRELDGIGADYNAFTSKEYTGYYAKASIDKLDTIMDVVFDIFLNSKIDEQAIAVEKGVIVEEINMYRDNPMRYVDELFERLLYGDQPAGWDVAGEKEIVTKLTRPQFLDYFNTHYIAENTIVAVAGNVDPAKIKEKTAGFFEHIRQAAAVKKFPVIEKQAGPQTHIFHKKTDQTHFILGFRGYHMFDKRKYVLNVLATILGGGMSSRLFDEVREKRGLAYYIGAGSQHYTDTGYFAVNAGVNNEKAHEAVKVVLQEIRKVKKEGVTVQELRQAKDHIHGKTALGLEHSDAVAQAYAGPLLFENKILTPEEELAKIEAVTAEQILEAADDIFRPDKLNLALIGPFEDDRQFKQHLEV